MNIYDVSAALDDLMHKVTLTRTAAGSRVKGEYIPGAEVDTTIMVNDQSMNPSETLLFVPEGNRKKNVRRVYCKVLLKVDNENTGEVADLLTIDGIKYKVILTDPWERFGKYYSALIEEVTQYGD
jgi:hypothetical protein